MCAISLMPSIRLQKENSVFSVNSVFIWEQLKRKISINNTQLAIIERLQINSNCHQHKPIRKELIRSIIDSDGRSYLIRMETTGRWNGGL